MWHVYILRSEQSNKYYIGMTCDIKKRLAYHNKGANKSTRSGRPWRIVYLEEFANKKDAWLRERQIKRYKGGQAFRKLLQ